MSRETTLAHTLATIASAPYQPVIHLRFYTLYPSGTTVDHQQAEEQCRQEVLNGFATVGLPVHVVTIRQQDATRGNMNYIAGRGSVEEQRAAQTIVICPVLYHFVTVRVSRWRWWLWRRRQ